MKLITERRNQLIEIDRDNIKYNLKSLQDTVISIDKLNNYVLSLKEIEIKKVSKFISSTGGLYEIIQAKLNENIDLYNKQINVENICLAYDNQWFEKELESWKNNKSTEIQSLVLHDLYRGIRNKFEIILSEASVNKFKKINNLINSTGVYKEANNQRGLALIIMCSLGIHLCLNIAFTTTLKEIFRQGSHGALYQTLISKIGKSMINQFNHMFKPLDIENNNKRFKHIWSSNISNKDTLINLIKENFEFINKEWLQTSWIELNIGQTLTELLIVNDKVFRQENIQISPIDKELRIYINESYYHRLNASIINITQLPMLTLPREPKEDGTNYMPYILPDISYYSNTFNTVINDTFKNKFKTENIGRYTHQHRLFTLFSSSNRW